MSRDFALGEYKFAVGRLKVKESLRGLRLVSKVLLPALAEAHSAPKGQVGSAVTKAVEGLDCLPDLLDLFSPVTKVSGPQQALQNPVVLEPFVETVFGGRPDRVVQFLVECVQAEYGSFLAEDGPFKGALGKAMAKAVAQPEPSDSPTT